MLGHAAGLLFFFRERRRRYLLGGVGGLLLVAFVGGGPAAASRSATSSSRERLSTASRGGSSGGVAPSRGGSAGGAAASSAIDLCGNYWSDSAVVSRGVSRRLAVLAGGYCPEASRDPAFDVARRTTRGKADLYIVRGLEVCNTLGSTPKTKKGRRDRSSCCPLGLGSLSICARWS